jgi:hypothetical protein
MIEYFHANPLGVGWWNVRRPGNGPVPAGSLASGRCRSRWMRTCCGSWLLSRFRDQSASAWSRVRRSPVKDGIFAGSARPSRPAPMRTCPAAKKRDSPSANRRALQSARLVRGNYCNCGGVVAEVGGDAMHIENARVSSLPTPASGRRRSRLAGWGQARRRVSTIAALRA